MRVEFFPAAEQGWALAERLGVPFFDADDYYWLPTNPPFKAKREHVSRLNLFLQSYIRHLE